VFGVMLVELAHAGLFEIIDCAELDERVSSFQAS
jgi:hypothetical protein